jgi:hypothetical protein
MLLYTLDPDNIIKFLPPPGPKKGLMNEMGNGGITPGVF